MPATLYKYGMKLRGFGPMCQPMDGLVTWSDAEKDRDGCWSYLFYSRKLSEQEVSEYELEYIGTLKPRGGDA